MAGEGIYYCEACKAGGVHTHVRSGQAICRRCQAEVREPKGATQSAWPGIRPNTRLPGCIYWPFHAYCLIVVLVGRKNILWGIYSAATHTPLKYWPRNAGSHRGMVMARAPWTTGPSAPPGSWQWWAALVAGVALVLMAVLLVFGYRRWDRAEPWRDNPLA